MSRWRAIVRNELEQWLADTGRREVTLGELEDRLLPKLESEFPENDNVDAGLRRTLQELRDEGDLIFHGGGEYELTLDPGPDVAEMFEAALRDYPEVREAGDFQHEAARMIADDIPDRLRESLPFDHISIRGSVGTGRIANVPWIGIFDERVTTDPKSGLYVVYLFDTEAGSVFLTLNQGMTDLQEEYGRPTARSILADRTEALRHIVEDGNFATDDIPLASELLTSRNNLYGISSICYREYSLPDFPPSSEWIEDVSRLIEEYQRLVDEGLYDELLEAFKESTAEQANPFDGEALPPPIDEYGGVNEATNDVLGRMETCGGEITEFRDRLSKAVVAEWTEPLKGIAVKEASEISPDEAALIHQIKRVYEWNEGWLTERAEELGIGSLFALDPPQVLYMALVRDVQSEIAEVSQLNVNHVKLKTIFEDEYSILRDKGQVPDDSTHPLLSYIEENEGDVAVHLFTGPPDYWLTSIRYRAVSFSEQFVNRWDQVSEGDVALFHSGAEPGNDAISLQANGFIGAVIIGQKFEKEEDWWWDEFNGDMSFPYIATFERQFLTGDIGAIDQSVTIDDQSDEEIEADLKPLTSGLLPFGDADSICREATGRGLAAQGAFNTFRTESGALEYERPRVLLQSLAPLLSEVSAVNIHFDVYPSFSSEVLDGLYFPGDQGEEILDEVEAAIRSGKHVVLTGPPGTGKTEIAERVADHLAESYPHLFTGSKVTTATADWSTFDTVGGYMPSETTETDTGESLSFTPGTILNRFRNDHTDVPLNEPVVIDELNRADIDKAFGQLFTVLSGQSVTLPYTRDGEEIEILPVSDVEGEPTRHQYAIPNSWRILATMNTYDKTSLYEMSYAFMRRFAFVRVGAPDIGGSLPATMDSYISAWEHDGLEINLDRNELDAIGRVWRMTNSAVEERAIGPAIIRDIVLFMDNHDAEDLQSRLTRAVIAYVFPQLEGVPKRRDIVENVAKLDDVVHGDRLRDVGSEMLQITFEEA